MMNRTFTRSLSRRVEALESAAAKATTQKRDPLLEISIRAMACAWTPDEVEGILAAAERSKLDELPADLRRRWVEHLDQISMRRFGKSFQALLARAQLDLEAPPAPGFAGLLKKGPGTQPCSGGADQNGGSQGHLSTPARFAGPRNHRKKGILCPRKDP